MVLNRRTQLIDSDILRRLSGIIGNLTQSLDITSVDTEKLKFIVKANGKYFSVYFDFTGDRDGIEQKKITDMFRQTDVDGKPLIMTELLLPYEKSYFIWKWVDVRCFQKCIRKCISQSSVLYLCLMFNINKYAFHHSTTDQCWLDDSPSPLPLVNEMRKCWFSLFHSGIFESLGILPYISNFCYNPPRKLIEFMTNTENIYFSQFLQTIDVVFGSPIFNWWRVRNLFIDVFMLQMLDHPTLFPNLERIHIRARTFPNFTQFETSTIQNFRSKILKHPRLRVFDVTDVAIDGFFDDYDEHNFQCLVQMSNFVADIAAMVEFLGASHEKFRRPQSNRDHGDNIQEQWSNQGQWSNQEHGDNIQGQWSNQEHGDNIQGQWSNQDHGDNIQGQWSNQEHGDNIQEQGSNQEPSESQHRCGQSKMARFSSSVSWTSSALSTHSTLSSFLPQPPSFPSPPSPPPLIQFLNDPRFDRNLLAIFSAYATDASVGKKFL